MVPQQWWCDNQFNPIQKATCTYVFAQIINLMQQEIVTSYNYFQVVSSRLNKQDKERDSTVYDKKLDVPHLLPAKWSKVCVKIFWRHICFIILISVYIMNSLSVPHLDYGLIRPLKPIKLWANSQGKGNLECPVNLRAAIWNIQSKMVNFL